ncbi:ATP-binding protein [Candidatus Bathyarchaeota archaeon]|nr:ATP-binding protein [Candidatus Bathyarchaeota archaeon]
MPLFSLNPKESPRELFGRDREMKELISLVRERRWTAILGPRMVGKTSIIKATNKRLEGMNVRTIYVNLWGVKGVNGLLNALAHGINEDRNIWNKIKDFAERIEGISFGPGGITISISRKPMTTLLDLFSALGRQSEDYVIELDEAQELSAISGHLLKLLARIFNTYPNIIFIFTGSMFGLMKTLLEPKSTSPLYGRAPARLYLQPFPEETAAEFLRKGFQEYRIPFKESWIREAIDKLGGVPGWLTLYGNNVAVRRMPHERALEETVSEGMKIVRDELEHFLQERDRTTHIAVLKVAATSARWREVKAAIEARRGYPVNDATVRNALESLKAAMLIKEDHGTYRVEDPMLRNLLITSEI